ncbi:MAG: lipoyl(octanoyl) transferase LipB [Chloroflexi bacterium]|nr:lipoyl(octanoyl) transferase LipB [Chloroflexota bacterium]MDA1147848.1 lipoyl(octanoyl) transferase LipB [Chloroflexota bacterium]
MRLHRADAVDYRIALDWQLATAEAIRDSRGAPASNGAVSEVLALIQHRPVYTLGARADGSNILVSRDALAACDATVIETDRGGDVTFHGPGQLVVYPILDLHARGIRPVDYVRLLEQTAIDVLEAFDLRGERVRGRPGVWIDGAKVAAVGVRVSRGVSTHGLALNVDTDLAWFDAIVPCGIADAEVTSMARLLEVAPRFEDVVDAYRVVFEQRFDSHLVDADSSPLGTAVAEAVLA